MTLLNKPALRQQFRDIRRHIPVAYRKEAAHAAAALLTQQPLFQQSQHIACYLAYQDEFDAMPIIQAIWQAKKHCYLPVLEETNGKRLHFVNYNDGDSLRQNRHGIFEPHDISKTIPPTELEIVITPLIAFDLHGNRLGTGGGYYDRTFAHLRTSPQKPPLIGLAFAVQQADVLSPDEWDITLDYILTEKDFLVCKKS